MCQKRSKNEAIKEFEGTLFLAGGPVKDSHKWSTCEGAAKTLNN